jgi:hypothetical protein
MRILIVEDDLASRRLLKTLLFKYGDCDIAVNGEEAVESFRLALEEGAPYDNEAFFKGEATSYVVKPLDQGKIVLELQSMGLIDAA